MADNTSDTVWVAFPGLRLLADVELEIGGQRIKLVGAQKHQAATSMCKVAENSFGDAHYPFHGHGTNMGMSQMLVAC
jgi:hypothetical protein